MDAKAFQKLLARAIELSEKNDRAQLEELLRAHPEQAERIGHGLRQLGELSLLDAGPKPGEPPRRLGEFRLLQELGCGGMGVVYLAEQESLQRRVAVKLVRPELLASEVVRARFQREVGTIAKLQHPGIVQVLAVGAEGDVPYFAMELCTGRSLSDLLEHLRDAEPSALRRSDFDRAIGTRSAEPAASGAASSWWHACASCIAEVADTMAFVHEHRVVHRDLKPSNIVVTPQGRTKLLDFGLAHVATDPRLTQSGSEIGSPAYMAPEQLRGEALDERTDIYSLGVALYELLSLRLPFRAKSPAALRAEIELGDAAPLSTQARHLPRDLAIVVAKAMDPDPAARYASMTVFARDLRAVLLSEPILARSPGFAARCARWRRRHPFAAGALALAAAVLVLLPLPLWLWQRDQSGRLDHALTRAESDLMEVEGAIARMLEHSSALDLSRLPEVQPLRLQLVGDAIAFYERMIERHPEETRLKIAHAECCWRFGLDLRVAGEYERAQEMLARAESYYASPSIAEDRYVFLQHVLTLKAAAQLSRERGDLERSERELDRMEAAAKALLARWPNDFDGRMQSLEALNSRAHVRHAQGRSEEQLALQRAAVEGKRRLVADSPEQSMARETLAMSCINLADVLCSLDRDAGEAEALYAEAETILNSTAPNVGEPYHGNLRSEAWLGLGAMARRRGDLPGAKATLLRAHESQRALLRIHPSANFLLTSQFSICLELARVELGLRAHGACESWLRASEEVLESLKRLDVKDSFSAALTDEKRAIEEELRSATR